MSIDKISPAKLLLDDGTQVLFLGQAGSVLRARFINDEEGILETSERVITDDQWITVGSFEVKTGEITWNRTKAAGEDLLIMIPNPVETHPDILRKLVYSRALQANVESLFKAKVVKVIVH